MKMKGILALAVLTMVSLAGAEAAEDGLSSGLDSPRTRQYREILKLQENGMHNRSRIRFREVGRQFRDSDPEGYAVLSEVIMGIPSYEHRMERFINSHPYSRLIPQIRYRHALNLFDRQDYKAAGELLDSIPPVHIERSQVNEYLFKKAYCELERGDADKALLRFMELEKRPVSDYTAPARYSIAYINYGKKNFVEALSWFEKSVSDGRFTEMSNYYIMECRFMMKDYDYVTENGDRMYRSIPEDRKPHLARIISESWLVLGNASEARRYYDLTARAAGAPKSRTDWFYSGSVLYAVEDYKGAIESFNMMQERTDSLGQVAEYHLGYSYIQTRNKVAALEAFKAASKTAFDPVIAEDAYFNWAKLAFDINDDPSVFQDYMKRYSDRAKDDKIYSYIAVAALHDRDYMAAVDAYGMIDELDDDMRSNYMKANYLRAHQLISAGSYRLAIKCLRVAAYYSDRSSRFNQLTRFWLAESYYRNDQYAQARELYTELFNQSALHRQPEADLIPYNIAYCHFKEGDYDSAKKWFTSYLDGKSAVYRKDALERVGDCHFIAKDYRKASASYDLAVKEGPDVNDIYPYYQSAISYGLSGDNDRKIALLSDVLEADPSSQFYPDAVFELGRAYVVKEDDENAFACFDRLAKTARDTTFIAKAYIEMGSLSRNQSQFNDALSYYRKVVEEMPMSGYAEDALAAIESIYQTRNEPEEFLAYIETIGKGTSKSEDEKENMIFNAAEQNYLSSNYQKALVSLQAYVEKYPEGRYMTQADFYMADSYRNLGKYEQACDSYRKVINAGTGSFIELSMLNFSDLSYRLERWDDAFGGYASLYNAARFENNKVLAIKGMMRSAFRGHIWDEALRNADRILFDNRMEAEVKREAEYVKARSYMATSRRNEALAIMNKLSDDVRDEYGAEAAYTLILDSYDKGDFADVETKVYAFSDAGSPQTYWLAKSFIVLGDSFADREDLAQAKATFESVRDGYTPSGSDDDILDNVRMRLEKLEEMMSSAN